MSAIMASSALAATPSTVLPCYSMSKNSHFIRISHCNRMWVLKSVLFRTLSGIVRSKSALRSISTTSILASSAATCRAVWDLWWAAAAWDRTHTHLVYKDFAQQFHCCTCSAGTLSVALMSHPAFSRQWMTGMWLFFTARWRGASWSWRSSSQI